MEKTRQEQEELLERARRDILAERERAVTELRREAVDLSLAAASKLIGERLNSETDAEDRAGISGQPGKPPLRTETVARNYAEALFELGERSGHVDRYADLIDAVAAAVEQTPGSRRC